LKIRFEVSHVLGRLSAGAAEPRAWLVLHGGPDHVPNLHTPVAAEGGVHSELPGVRDREGYLPPSDSGGHGNLVVADGSAARQREERYCHRADSELQGPRLLSQRVSPEAQGDGYPGEARDSGRRDQGPNREREPGVCRRVHQAAATPRPTRRVCRQWTRTTSVPWPSWQQDAEAMSQASDQAHQMAWRRFSSPKGASNLGRSSEWPPTERVSRRGSTGRNRIPLGLRIVAFLCVSFLVPCETI